MINGVRISKGDSDDLVIVFHYNPTNVEKVKELKSSQMKQSISTLIG